MDLIRAVITAKATVSGRIRYAWKEQIATYATGADTDPLGKRTGTTTVNPAIEVNNHDVDVGTVVWLRARGYVAGAMWYEFQYEPSGSALLNGWQACGLSPGGFSWAVTSTTTWAMIGSPVTLPGAGTYLLWATASGGIVCGTPPSSGTQVLRARIKAAGTTTSPATFWTQTHTNLAASNVSGQMVLGSGFMQAIVTLTGAPGAQSFWLEAVIALGQLQSNVSPSGTVSAAWIYNAFNPEEPMPMLGYLKLA